MTPRSRSSRLWGAFLAATVAALGLQACGSSENAAPAPVVAAPVGPPGAAVYERSCARCHGLDRMGKEGNPALTSVKLASLGDQQLRLNIAMGKGKMPAFGGLTQVQVDDLVAYLRGA